MPSIAGRKCTVSWSPNDGTYSAIAGIDSVSDSVGAAPINDDEFGDEWSQNVSGILSNKITMSGGFRPGDTDGQVAMRTAMLAGDFGWFKILYDGTTNGYKQQVLVSKFSASTAVADKTKLSIELDGNGAITLIP